MRRGRVACIGAGDFQFGHSFEAGNLAGRKLTSKFRKSCDGGLPLCITYGIRLLAHSLQVLTEANFLQ